MTNTTSNFPTVGDSFPHSVVNLSGERRPYTIQAPRDKGGATNSNPPGPGKVNRSASLIHEANGPRFSPVAKIVYPNAEAAGAVQRNTKFMPGTGFWTKRAEGPRIG